MLDVRVLHYRASTLEVDLAYKVIFSRFIAGKEKTGTNKTRAQKEQAGKLIHIISTKKNNNKQKQQSWKNKQKPSQEVRKCLTEIRKECPVKPEGEKNVSTRSVPTKTIIDV